MTTLLSNFHSHTTYCDGSLSAGEMARAAIERGLCAFGFSGHALSDLDEAWTMSRAGTARYKREVARLKAQYADRIELYCGVEQDYFSNEPPDGYDFVIGSVHSLRRDGRYIPVDSTPGEQRGAVEAYYGGDYLAFTRDYYELEANLIARTRADIVGHFDLVTKFNEGGRLFDEADPRYRRQAVDAMIAILETCRLFEVNTGAMYRNGRSDPFPAPFLLRELRSRGGEVILSSDSHDAPSICYAFPEMWELLRACGFRYVKTLARGEWVDIKL